MFTSLSTLARVAILLLAAAVGIIVVGVRRRIPQDPAYHDFADGRAVAGIPNFWNVASNLPYAVVGILGLTVLCEAQQAGILPGLRAPFATFFSAAILVAAGSAYYHLHPNNSTLVWDRLPMTIGFMSFFTIVLGEHLTPHLARLIFVPLLAIGVGTVLYWVVTEYAERSDLRPYLVIQFLPLLLTPLILILFPSRLNKAWLYWLLLSAYAVAKVAETFDRAIYERTGFVSGHTLKHLLAAAGMLLVVIAARDRKIVAADRLEPGASNPRLQRTRSAALAAEKQAVRPHQETERDDFHSHRLLTFYKGETHALVPLHRILLRWRIPSERDAPFRQWNLGERLPESLRFTAGHWPVFFQG